MKVITDQKFLSKHSTIVLEEEQKYIVKMLCDFMYENKNAAGISAIQLGMKKKAFAINSPVIKDVVVFINPELISFSNPYKIKENCLSIPNETYLVERYRNICIADKVHGAMSIDGKEAQIWQHEYDHLQGTLINHHGLFIKE